MSPNTSAARGRKAPAAQIRAIDRPGAENLLLMALVATSALGDDRAFAELHDRTAGQVFAKALRVLGDVAQAEEVTQEVYLDVWTHPGGYEASRSPVIAYLLLLAHRRAVDRVRSAHASAVRDALYARRNIAREHDPVADTVIDRSQAVLAHQLMRQLSADHREAVTRRYFGDQTHTQIAVSLGIPLGTAKGRIRDGMQALRRAATATTESGSNLPKAVEHFG